MCNFSNLTYWLVSHISMSYYDMTLWWITHPFIVIIWWYYMNKRSQLWQFNPDINSYSPSEPILKHYTKGIIYNNWIFTVILMSHIIILFIQWANHWQLPQWVQALFRVNFYQQLMLLLIFLVKESKIILWIWHIPS